jgi:hypothetical protein
MALVPVLRIEDGGRTFRSLALPFGVAAIVVDRDDVVAEIMDVESVDQLPSGRFPYSLAMTGPDPRPGWSTRSPSPPPAWAPRASWSVTTPRSRAGVAGSEPGSTTG